MHMNVPHSIHTYSMNNIVASQVIQYNSDIYTVLQYIILEVGWCYSALTRWHEVDVGVGK